MRFETAGQSSNPSREIESSIEVPSYKDRVPTLGEHLDAYERSRPEEQTEIDPYAAQRVYLLVAALGGVLLAAGLAFALSALLLIT